MLCDRINECVREMVPHEGGVPRWRREEVRSAEEMDRLLGAVAEEMAALGYPAKEAFAVRLALEEAVVNAHRHGHGGDWATPVGVCYHVGASSVVAQVEDRGPGFDPAAVPDPLAPENLERDHGRGLLLMRS